MTDRIPQHLRKNPPADASAAKIVAAGASVAAGLGIIGALVATQSQPAAAPPLPQSSVQRVIVVQQSAADPADPLPPSASATPTAIVVERPPVAVSEGS
ncbi:MAG: hypothetical protein GY713_16975 [Actinomycetia bacterium]|nr:hypothetical protein [Actinomycetes bacterium]MCP3912636.1 hypothetical protein [Actinomycetes bacterium]